MTINFWKQKVCWHHPACFTLLPQVNFPANNFHWRWRWWDRIQAIFLNLFYFSIRSIWMIQILLHKKFCPLWPPGHRFWNGWYLSLFTHFSARWLNWWLEVDISAIKFGVRDVILVLMLAYFKYLVSCETVAILLCFIRNHFMLHTYIGLVITNKHTIFIYRRRAIITRSWILTIHKGWIFWKKPPWINVVDLQKVGIKYRNRGL